MVDFKKLLEREEWIEKIRKLIALSRNNPNANEAASAKAKAADLMSRYSIRVEELGVSFEQDEQAGGSKAKESSWKGAGSANSAGSANNGSFHEDEANSDDEFAPRRPKNSAGMQELYGVWKDTRFRKDKFVIGFLESGETLKGESDEGDLCPGITYRFYGYWTNHPSYGRQFSFKQFVVDVPHSYQGIVAYIVKTCSGSGIGRTRAGLIYELFGQESIRVLTNNPSRVAKALSRKLGHKTDRQLEKELSNCKIASEQLSNSAKFQDVKIDLMDLFANTKIPSSTIDSAIKRWKILAPQRIKRDPYLLLTARFRGVGFGRCDNLYAKLGHDPARLKRQTLCIWHHLETNRDGHTWFNVNEAVNALEKMIDGAVLTPKKALRLGVRARWLAKHVDENGKPWVTDAKKALNELSVARSLTKLINGETKWPAIDFEGIFPHQREQLTLATKGPVSILIGTPGTGKTSSVAELICHLVNLYGYGAVAVCAPTGKAAVRITEMLKAKRNFYGRATTIHRLLDPRPLKEVHGVGDRESDGDNNSGWVFTHNENNPLRQTFVIVDEASMISVNLLAPLLRACSQGTNILFVGDIHQLPPVEHGAPLRDMIDFGLPCGELSEIHRNNGLIVRSCAALKKNGTILSCEKFNNDGNNLRIIDTTSANRVLSIIESVCASVKEKGHDPLDHVQVIVPLNDNGPVSRVKLNEFMQNLLNTEGKRAEGNPFRVGDKVICIKNGMYDGYGEPQEYKINMDGDEAPSFFLANGEQGRVIGVTPLLTIMEFQDIGDGKRKIKVSMRSEDKDRFILAYALTCHKCQGSEYPVGIVVADDSHAAGMVMDRSWFYTAISRFRERCIVIGSKATIAHRCKQQKIHKRKTFLAQLMRDRTQGTSTGKDFATNGMATTKSVKAKAF